MSVERAQQLLAVLDLETLDENFYRGQNEIRGERRLFGGQVLAQALSAAIRTVHEKRSPHSLHGYFLRPGRSSQPVIYQVERIRDGRSFATRRVLAIQQGEAIFNLEASFQVAEAGLTYQATMLQVVDPETLAEDPAQDSGVGAANAVWMRYKVPVPNSWRLHAALLAYASDMSFVSTAFMPHGSRVQRGAAQIASLDHAMWFHRVFDVSEWLVYVKESPAAAGARGYNRGQFFDQAGNLAASTMQEGLMRQRTPLTPRGQVN